MSLLNKMICKMRGHVRTYTRDNDLNIPNNLNHKGQQDLVCSRCGERYGYARFVFKDKDVEDKYRKGRR